MMRLKSTLKWLLAFSLSTICLNVAFSHAETVTTEASLAPMLKQVTPGVVNIVVQSNQPMAEAVKLLPNIPRNQLPKGIKIGSGVIFEAKHGLIVTNAHVVKDAKHVVVTLKNGRHYLAKVVGEDDGFDLAVLAIHAEHLNQIPFGDSDKVQVGDFVAAIGSPYGLSQSVTSGMVSALNRSEPKIEGFQSFIQTDAPINPGNSGGALVNMKGQLVGINTAILAPVDGNTGIGFAIPSNMVKEVIKQLLQYGKVSRGMLGVIAQNITPDLADALGISKDSGVIVTEVAPGTPAAKAGIQDEDIIAAVNHHKVRDAVQLHNMLGLLHPGTKLAINIIRNHKSENITATVANPNKLLAQKELPFIGGLSLQQFSEIETDGSKLQGVLVTNVDDASQGALAGLMPGDVILSANNHSIASLSDIQHIVERHPQNLLLKIARNNTKLLLVIDQQ